VNDDHKPSELRRVLNPKSASSHVPVVVGEEEEEEIRKFFPRFFFLERTVKSARARASDDDDKKDYFDKDNRRIKQRLTKTNSELAITCARASALFLHLVLYFFLCISFRVVFSKRVRVEKKRRKLFRTRARARMFGDDAVRLNTSPRRYYELRRCCCRLSA
jgi:hypothetical protein